MIVGNYQIEAESIQVTVSERSIVQAHEFGLQTKPENIGKEKWSPIGYYATLPNALWGLSQYHLNKSDMATVEQVLAKIDELIVMISKVTNIPVDLLPFNRAATQKPIDHTDDIVDPPENDGMELPKRGRGRPRKVLSPEHLAAMQTGRENARLAKGK